MSGSVSEKLSVVELWIPMTCSYFCRSSYFEPYLNSLKNIAGTIVNLILHQNLYNKSNSSLTIFLKQFWIRLKYKSDGRKKSSASTSWIQPVLFHSTQWTFLDYATAVSKLNICPLRLVASDNSPEYWNIPFENPKNCNSIILLWIIFLLILLW